VRWETFVVPWAQHSTINDIEMKAKRAHLCLHDKKRFTGLADFHRKVDRFVIDSNFDLYIQHERICKEKQIWKRIANRQESAYKESRY
jgi:hypothetical protein